MPEHQEQQAAVAGLVPASLGRLDQPLDLAPGEVLPVAVVPAPCFCFCARSSFCREFSPSNAPETRINRAGAFQSIDKMVHFVEWEARRGGGGLNGGLDLCKCSDCFTMESRELQIQKDFGDRLRKLRKQKELSQEALALACDLDRTYIGGVERGERNISLINIYKIAEALGCDAKDLF
jgi:DNA-binding XRE family transcriptional regulator